MDQFLINHMIIDDEFNGEESVTADFTLNQKKYKVTFTKSDLEIINTWYFDGNKSVPANLSETIIESVREEILKNI